MRPGKISQLPRVIRDQLNHRLENGHATRDILTWLNSLPEAQALLAAQFENKPIIKQNLHDWKKTGFHKWQLRRAALEFATEGSDDSPADQALSASISQKLSQWVAIRFAAAAEAAPPSDDPEADLRQLHDLCAAVLALRRGDLHAERVSLEHKRLSLLQAQADQDREKLFWEWTARPDVRAKLFPQRNPDQLRLEVERMLNFKLLGIPYPHPHHDEHSDPAILI